MAAELVCAAWMAAAYAAVLVTWGIPGRTNAGAAAADADAVGGGAAPGPTRLGAPPAPPPAPVVAVRSKAAR
jgi:hypothetical protein